MPNVGGPNNFFSRVGGGDGSVPPQIYIVATPMQPWRRLDVIRRIPSRLQRQHGRPHPIGGLGSAERSGNVNKPFKDEGDEATSLGTHPSVARGVRVCINVYMNGLLLAPAELL